MVIEIRVTDVGFGFLRVGLGLLGLGLLRVTRFICTGSILNNGKSVIMLISPCCSTESVCVCVCFFHHIGGNRFPWREG